MFRLSHIAGAMAVLTLTACASQQPLLDQASLKNWELVTVPAAPMEGSVRFEPNGVIALSGQPVGYLATTASYSDYRLHAEWRWSGKPGNAGVLLHIVGGPKDRAWPESLQVQTKQGSVGDLLPMAGAKFSEALTSAPGAAVPLKAKSGPDSEKPAGEWNSVDIVSRAGTIDVTVNGVRQNAVSGAQPAAGRIGFQFEGTPYELRNVTVAPL